MSAQESNADGSIQSGSPLARALDDFPVPGLSAGFADKVVAAAADRAAPLPKLRQNRGVQRWRLGRRVAIGVACFGALATAAAATGLLERFDIPVPSPEKVWASLTGNQAAADPVLVPSAPVSPVVAAVSPVKIEGPIDTPEELGEAFRRIDEVRQGRLETRRELIDQRIDRALERRRAAGLPVPTPEEEARLRQRIDEVRALRQQRADERIKARREELERKVDSGEVLTRDDIVRPMRDNEGTLERREQLRQLRQMTPQERRAALRRLPPEQRRALLEEFRAWRGQPSVRDEQESGPAEPVETPTPPPAPLLDEPVQPQL